MQATNGKAKKGSAEEDRSQSTCKSCYCCGATLSHLKKDCPTRDEEFYKCGKKGHFKGTQRSKKEEKKISRVRDMRKTQKLAKVNELNA